MTLRPPSPRRFRNLLGRILLLLVGMFLAALGIGFTTTAGLGTTPISTVPYTGAAITGISFGMCTVILNFAFVAGQIILLRKRYRPINLIQIPVGFVFGVFIDFAMHLVGGLIPPNWFVAAAMSLFGNVVLALGTVLQIRSKTIVQPGEGLVIVAAALSHKSFGTMKICNDVSLTVVAALMGILFLGHIEAIREGTLVSAVMIGLFAKLIDKLFTRLTPAPKVVEPREVPLPKEETEPHEVKLK
ncbi:YitT family protein [Sutterella sp.]|uniref:YczE/YyaS/YitT family protein n=1 Tax=Sutterella sp. TaxID=1981025 RepID=UPI0026DEE1BC|nr:DUF6198 family protein [Sutterella sp.]MDO5531106.1 DUF6198 family protein [Sutterella sp.]